MELLLVKMKYAQWTWKQEAQVDINFPHQLFTIFPLYIGSSLVAQLVKNLPAMWETWVPSLGWEDLLESKWLSTPVFWPGELHGLYSPWGRKEPDTIEHFDFYISTVYTGYSAEKRVWGWQWGTTLKQKGSQLCRTNSASCVSPDSQGRPVSALPWGLLPPPPGLALDPTTWFSNLFGTTSTYKREEKQPIPADKKDNYQGTMGVLPKSTKLGSKFSKEPYSS